MIKRTLYFGNPAYLSKKMSQLVINIPGANGVDDKTKANTIPIEDIGVVVLDIMDSGVDFQEITTDIKIKLLSIPRMDININGQSSPLMVGVIQTTSSLYKCFKGEGRKIIYPVL